MWDVSGRTVFRAAGEAIGNVGRRLWRRRFRRRYTEEALQRWMERVPVPSVPLDGVRTEADNQVIDASYRVLSEKGAEAK